MTGREFNVEPGDQGVYEVVAPYLERKVCGKGEVGRLDGVEVEEEDGGRVGDDGLHVDGVDERFAHGRLFQRREVEAPDVVPDCGGFSTMT